MEGESVKPSRPKRSNFQSFIKEECLRSNDEISKFPSVCVEWSKWCRSNGLAITDKTFASIALEREGYTITPRSFKDGGPVVEGLLLKKDGKRILAQRRASEKMKLAKEKVAEEEATRESTPPPTSPFPHPSLSPIIETSSSSSSSSEGEEDGVVASWEDIDLKAFSEMIREAVHQ